MLEPKKMLDDLWEASVPGTDSTVAEAAGQARELARENPLATAVLAALLLGTGGGRALAGAVLEIGGLAAIAGLAYQAYKNYQSGDAPTELPGGLDSLLPPPDDTAFHHSRSPQGEGKFAMTLVRAMIAAAQADGTVDDAERLVIRGRLQESGIDEDGGSILDQELRHPVDVGKLVAAARTDAQKVELYTASRLAIDVDTPVERSYLQALAARLKLPDNLVRHVEATVVSSKA